MNDEGAERPLFRICTSEKKWWLGKKPKKKPDKCLALSFEGAIEANLQRGTLSLRKWEEETQR
ncbi:hypothetical protein CEV32_1003 [Brucella rhizosphaerae]|uniref:Uncharacterized protein n=1 Tax=Brucella rhizosphaerae TaxID=571254 RepID=A0A256FDF3_9HYPH|nr:hypothetical protein CEV32_1003 [Brucella rhizosphaerae]